jgi:quercetin dioxygenase-like cupin family protein
MRWYVRNVRDMKWYDVGPRGFVTELVDVEDEEPQVGFNLFVLAPGNPMAMYHWEADQEGFLVLSGEALLIVEDEERPLRQWDYFHCPPNVPHTIVGAGSGPCAILALGARIDSVKEEGWGAYPYSELAMNHDASAEEETADPKVAYARFPSGTEGEFQEDWLP